ncbi:MAG: carbohydrate kinase family protein [Candidatus Heimdallarchaeota archaeon]
MARIIILGSITEDTIYTHPDTVTQFIGGVPIYAASVAKALGEKIGIVSKVGTDFHIKNLKVINSLDADLTGFKITGQSSMKFENVYSETGKRTQNILSVSDKIVFEDIPKQYFNTSCIHLGPVFNEISEKLISQVRESFDFVSLDGQGFTRGQKENSKKIILHPWLDYETFLPKLDVLKVDDLELKGITGSTKLDEAIDKALATGIELLVITKAHKGAIIYHKKKRYDIPVIPVDVVDATGAGDTFITAFLLEYLKTKDCYYSGLIAATAAAFKISFSGPIPTYNRQDILTKLKSIYPDFEEK